MNESRVPRTVEPTNEVAEEFLNDVEKYYDYMHHFRIVTKQNGMEFKSQIFGRVGMVKVLNLNPLFEGFVRIEGNTMQGIANGKKWEEL